MSKKILIIDDDFDVLKSLSNQLRDYGFSVLAVDNSQKALKIIDENIILVLLDLKLKDFYGLDLLKKIKDNYSHLSVIIITGYGDVPTAVEALKAGADDFIVKPPNINELIKKIELYIEKYSLKSALYDSLSSRLGKSRKIKRIIKDIDSISNKKLSIIITGENGVGKSYLAKMIFDMSPYKNEEYHKINFLTETRDLDLFGGVNKSGALNEIEKGFIVFNDIEKLNFELQIKLLDFLDEKCKDLQIVCTSQKNLVELVKNKLFYEDLFYFLAEFNIHIPSLKERKSDIPFFAKKFLYDEGEELKSKVERIDESAMKTLVKYDWSNNIRELKTIIRKALILSESSTVTKELIEKILFENSNLKESSISGNGKKSIYKPKPLWQLEKQAIIEALRYYKGNKTDTAKGLELARTTLYKKLEEYNIDH